MSPSLGNPWPFCPGPDPQLGWLFSSTSNFSSVLTSQIIGYKILFFHSLLSPRNPLPPPVLIKVFLLPSQWLHVFRAPCFFELFRFLFPAGFFFFYSFTPCFSSTLLTHPFLIPPRNINFLRFVWLFMTDSRNVSPPDFLTTCMSSHSSSCGVLYSFPFPLLLSGNSFSFVAVFLPPSILKVRFPAFCFYRSVLIVCAVFL